MFTPARIFAALGLTCTGVLTLADASILPPWAKLAIGAAGMFCGIITAATGPVQNNSQLNAVAKEAVSQAKAAGG